MTTTDTTVEKVTINGASYIREDAVRRGPDHDSEVRIVVLQRGWVVVGRYREDGDRVLLSDAHVIERWGTTQGLGELVNGPTSKTQLRWAGSIEAHRLGVVLSIAADGAKWSL